MFSYSYILYIYIIFSYSYTLKILIVIKFYDTVYHTRNIHDTEYNNNMCDLCMCGKTNIIKSLLNCSRYYTCTSSYSPSFIML